MIKKSTLRIEIRSISKSLIFTVAFLFVSTYWSMAQSNTLLWRLGSANNSSSEFASQLTANPEVVTVPSDWSSRTSWSFMSKGMSGNKNPAMELKFNLATLPANGVLMKFKLLDADKLVPEMAVFSNSMMAGLIQLYGTQRTASPYEWKKTYQLYIPKELLLSGNNVIRLEVNQQAWHGSGIKPYMTWNWDYLSLESLAQPAKEPIHGKMTYLGTQITNCENCFDTNETTMLFAPNILKWLGIAYSNNTMRANFYKHIWNGEVGNQSKRLEYLQLLKAYNMTVIGQRFGTTDATRLNNGTAPAETNADGTLTDTPKQILDWYFENLGSYFQYHEVDNEPGLFNRSFKTNVALAKYINQVKPAHIKTVAPGWAYWPTNGDPSGWERDPAYRKQIEDLCQATNGHSYGRSYTEDQGGSFVENLETYGGVNDGWPKEYINTETGSEGSHTDFSEASSSQPHASIFDRIMRGHVSVVDRTMQHAAFFGWYGLFNYPTTKGDANGLQAYPGVDGEDTRVKTFRRLALAYATHGEPLKYEHLNKTDIAGKKVYFRAVNTSTLAPLPGSGATANKILLNFVNFEGTTQTMKVRVTLSGCGTVTGERIGAGNVYSSAVSSVSLNATPNVELTVQLGARESVQYILDIPSGTCSIDTQVPTIPSALTSTAKTSTSVNLSWTASTDNTAVTGYEIFVNGTSVGTSTGTTYNATGLACNTAYSFAVRARDAAGNWSARSTAVSVTTSACSTGIDLIVTDITWTPASPATGNLVTFSAVVKNQGTTATPAGTVIGVVFYVGGSVVAWSDNNSTSLAGGASRTLTSNSGPNGVATWTAGDNRDYTVVAIVDDVLRIAETNNNNNSTSETLTVAAVSPDLIVTDISWTPATPAIGSVVTFSATIKNAGNGASPAGTIHGVSFSVDGTTVTWSDNSSATLAAGASRTVTANGPAYTLTSGSHTVQAYVDDINRITNESNETNNKRSEDFASTNVSGNTSVISKFSGKAMEVSNSSTADGANAWTMTYTGASNQIWNIQPVGSYYKLTASHSGKALDVEGGITAKEDKAILQQWQYLGADNQLFSLVPVSGGYYKIIAKHSGKAVDVSGPSLDDRAAIHQFTYLGSDNQLWRLNAVLSASSSRELSENQESISDNSINLYPMPITQNELNINFFSESDQKLKIDFTSMDGHQVKSLAKSVNKGLNNFAVPVSEFSNGIYLLKIQSVGKRSIRKVIIAR